MSNRISSKNYKPTELIGNQNGLVSANFSAKLWRTTESLTWSHCCVSASKTIRDILRLVGSIEPSISHLIKMTHSPGRQRPRLEGKCKRLISTLQWPNLPLLPQSLPSLAVVTPAHSQVMNTTKNLRRSQTLTLVHLLLTRGKQTKLSSLIKPQPGLTYRTSEQT